MTRFPGPVVCSLALAARALAGGCLPAEHDPITAGDLAAAVPVFARIAPDTPIAPAPGPGVRRVFRSLELISLARSHSLALDSADDVCFELPMGTLDRAQVLAAMQAALPFPEARVEILETSLYPVPRGRVEFRREDLGTPALPGSPAPVTWRGSVVYGADQHFAIWARVLVTARVTRVVATEFIKAGSIIAASQLRAESSRAFPVLNDAATGIDQVAGRVAIHAMDPGAEIRLSQVERPEDIKRGDTVAIEVRSGAARVSLTAKSESNGRVGDTITVRNLHSNKVFQARVNGKDKAFVDAGVPEGN